MPDSYSEGSAQMAKPPADADRRQVQVSFRIAADQAAALERIAAHEDRTVSAELRRMIRRRLTQTDEKLPEAA